jgi:hypothetical protein
MASQAAAFDTVRTDTLEQNRHFEVFGELPAGNATTLLAPFFQFDRSSQSPPKPFSFESRPMHLISRLESPATG